MNAGIVTDEMTIRLGLEAARAEINAQAMGEDAHFITLLRKELNSLSPETKGPMELTRENAIGLLKIISEALDAPMLQQSNSGVFVEHGAIDLLRKLIDAIEDLNDGKTHHALKPAAAGANASLSRAERKYEQLLLDSVLIVQEANKFKSEGEARRFVVNCLRKKGRTWRGKPITRKTLEQRKHRIKKYI
jgi:hypothetical protein